MGTFIHYCTHCNAKLNVDNAWAGRSMKCPACGEKIIFPAVIEGSDLKINSSDNVPGNDDLPAPPDRITESGRPLPPDADFPEPPAADCISASAGMVKSPETECKAPLPPSPVKPPVTVKSPQFEDFCGISEKSVKKCILPEKRFERAVEKNNCNQNAAVPDSSCNIGKERYFWGRLGSASSYVLAVAVLLAAVYFSLNLYWEYCTAEDMIPEKQQLQQINKELNEREKRLSSQFKNAVNLLQGSGNIRQDGVLDGLLLAESICQRPDPMPLGLLSERELRTAQRVLEQYKQSSRKLKEEFIRGFGRLLLLDKKSASPLATVGAKVAQIILQAGEVNKKFYINEAAQLYQLEALEQTAAKVKNELGNTATSEQKEVIRRFEAANAFVRKQLFTSESNITVVKSSNKYVQTPRNADAGNIEQANKMIAALAGDWQLDMEIAGMDVLLKKVPVLSENFERKRNILLREFGKQLVDLWLKSLFGIFILLVLGDVLKAFFDKADILHRMEGRR